MVLGWKPLAVRRFAVRTDQRSAAQGEGVFDQAREA